VKVDIQQYVQALEVNWPLFDSFVCVFAWSSIQVLSLGESVHFGIENWRLIFLT
jgi:hypothetical protein